MRTLCIAMTPVTLEQIAAEADKCHILCISPSAYIRMRGTSDAVLPVEQYISTEEHRQLQQHLDTLSHTFGDSEQLFDYEISNFLTPFLYTEHLIRKAVEDVSPDRIVVFHHPAPLPDSVSGLDEIRTPLFSSMMQWHTFGNTPVRFVTVPAAVPAANGNSSLKLYFALYKTPFLIRILWKKLFPAGSKRKIAFFRQNGKIALLESLLHKHAGISLENIRDRIPAGVRFPLQHPEAACGITEAALRCLRQYVLHKTENMKAIQSIDVSSYLALIATDYTVPEGRVLSMHFRAAGKPVYFAAEGTGQPNNAIWPYVHHFFFDMEGATYFTLSTQLESFLKEKQYRSGSITTGYFGSNPGLNPITSSAYALYTRLKGKVSGKKTVLYALSPVVDDYSLRFYSEETPHEIVSHLVQFLDGIDTDRYHVIVKLHPASRDKSIIKDIAKGKDVTIAQFEPIEMMYRCADCTVVYHTSAGLQSLQHEVPVLIWNTTGRESYATTYSRELAKDNIVREASTPDELNDALAFLTSPEERSYRNVAQFLANTPANALHELKKLL